MLADQKRTVAEKCLNCALRGGYKEASRIRQQAYILNPPGTIGVDWTNFSEIWDKDSQYLFYLENEDFSDMNNTWEKKRFLKAGIFIDYLFGFRDMWGVKRQAQLSNELFYSAQLEEFLVEKNWSFECENRELIYASTKEKNISARIYYDSVNKNGLSPSYRPYIFKIGEYDLGFFPDTPQQVIDGRRKWLENYDEFEKIKKMGIAGFPKTFKTFEKHKHDNTVKYQEWAKNLKKRM